MNPITRFLANEISLHMHAMALEKLDSFAQTSHIILCKFNYKTVLIVRGVFFKKIQRRTTYACTWNPSYKNTVTFSPELNSSEFSPVVRRSSVRLSVWIGLKYVFSGKTIELAVLVWDHLLCPAQKSNMYEWLDSVLRRIVNISAM